MIKQFRNPVNLLIVIKPDLFLKRQSQFYYIMTECSFTIWARCRPTRMRNMVNVLRSGLSPDKYYWAVKRIDPPVII